MEATDNFPDDKHTFNRGALKRRKRFPRRCNGATRPSSLTQSKKLSDEQWGVLQEALHLAASSFGLQPWKFVVVTDDAKKTALRGVAWDQQQVEACSHLVVICAKKTHHRAGR